MTTLPTLAYIHQQQLRNVQYQIKHTYLCLHPSMRVSSLHLTQLPPDSLAMTSLMSCHRNPPPVDLIIIKVNCVSKVIECE